MDSGGSGPARPPCICSSENPAPHTILEVAVRENTTATSTRRVTGHTVQRSDSSLLGGLTEAAERGQGHDAVRARRVTQLRPSSWRMAAACRCCSACCRSSRLSKSSASPTSSGCPAPGSGAVASRSRGLGTCAAYCLAFSRLVSSADTTHGAHCLGADAMRAREAAAARRVPRFSGFLGSANSACSAMICRLTVLRFFEKSCRAAGRSHQRTRPCGPIRPNTSTAPTSQAPRSRAQAAASCRELHGLHGCALACEGLGARAPSAVRAP